MKGLSSEWACPKHFDGPVPRPGLSQAVRRACPKSGPVPSILKGLSQERACPEHCEGPVPRVGQSQAIYIHLDSRLQVARLALEIPWPTCPSLLISRSSRTATKQFHSMEEAADLHPNSFTACRKLPFCIHIWAPKRQAAVRKDGRGPHPEGSKSGRGLWPAEPYWVASAMPR